MTAARAVRGRWSVTAGWAILLAITLLVLMAPVLAPQRPDEQFRDRVFAPPMRIHLRDGSGMRAPFVYRQVLDDRVERRFHEDRTSPRSLVWLSAGRLFGLDQDEPLLLLGADSLGRDVFSRLLYGARLSLGVSLTASALAFAIGAPLGIALAVYRFPGRGALVVTANALLGLPPVVVGLVVFNLKKAIMRSAASH